MFRVAPPRPGKCLTVAPTRAASRPVTEARVAAATAAASPEKARAAITEPGAGRSATGARFTLTPTDAQLPPGG